MMKLIQSFKYAFRGIRYALLSQRNFRIQLIAFLLVVLAGIYYDLSLTHWAILLLVSSFVMTLEILNTAIEVIVDMISPSYDPKAEKAKDLAAGAVLMASVFAVIVGCALFVSYIF
jgi:diacylglycerol kinase